MANKDKIQEIIEKSGNDFHLEVAAFLRLQGWEVEVSPYYNDPATSKAREIDIVALKKYSAKDWFSGNSDEFALRLFIECKYIKDANVLWFEKKDVESAVKLAKDNSILRDLEYHGLQDVSTLPPKIHHYIQEGEVMRLGSKAGNTDPLYEAMNGCLNAMIFYKEHQYSGISNTIDFPIIAVDSFNNLHKHKTTTPPRI